MPFLMESAVDPSWDMDVAMYVVLSFLGLGLECTAYTKVYQGSLRWFNRRFRETGRTAWDQMKVKSVCGVACSGVFALAGLLVLFPLFGVFGIFWAICALLLTVMYVRQLFGRRRDGGDLPEDTADADFRRRLEQLETLRRAGLIDDQEYRERRRNIARKM